jgi:hypothetical protein
MIIEILLTLPPNEENSERFIILADWNQNSITVRGSYFDFQCFCRASLFCTFNERSNAGHFEER